MSEGVSAARARAPLRLPGGLSISGGLSLFAVVAVLVVVAVPRLRGLALQENEVDAHGTAELLARALARQAEERGEVPSLRALMRRPELSGVLADAELLAGGTLLRRHGYLFEVARLPASVSLAAAPFALFCGEAGAREALAIRAWPWAHGATGEAAILVTASGASLVHPNSAARWQGPGCAGEAVYELEGWRRTP